ncbi:MAG: tetratricopeptide repeat protein [Candidatus Obscuribacterales bacterium]|nr:tetratricopeptide repeat protein [Candidatus Obscuribacterales bacterium]
MSRLSNFIKDYPQNPEGHRVLAEAYNKMGMDGMYAEEIENAWRLSADSTEYLVVALRLRAVSDDHKKFESLSKEALARYRNNKVMLMKLSLDLQKNNQNFLALPYLKRALELAPEDNMVRSTYCLALLNQKRNQEMLFIIEPLHKNKDSAGFAALMSGMAFANLNMPKRALGYFEKAFTIDPLNPKLAESYYQVLMKLGKKQAAVLPALVTLAGAAPAGMDLEAVKKEIIPVLSCTNNQELKVLMSQVAMALGDPAKVAYFYFAMGDLMDRCRRIQMARDCYSSALNIDKSFGRGFMRLAHDLELLGVAPDTVLDLYSTALRLAPDDKEVIAHFKRMESRLAASPKDIAAMIKSIINQARYRS